MNANQIFKLIVVLGFIWTLAGCKKNDDSSFDSATADTVGSAVAGAASASDSGGSVVALQNTGEKRNFAASVKNQLYQGLFSTVANAAACSSTASALIIGGGGAGCTGSNMTLSFGGCTGLLSATWTGTSNLTFNSGVACTNANGGGFASLGSGNSVAITSASGITRTGVSGNYVVVDSSASGYSQSLSGGVTVTCNSADCSSAPGRTVNITGQHRALYAAGGTKLFDHTLSTPTPLTITGVGASKVISAGTVQLQHNLAKYTATATITQALTFTASCCHPTGGAMTVTYASGTRTGTETLTFGPSCGAATANGNSISLVYCQ